MRFSSANPSKHLTGLVSATALLVALMVAAPALGGAFFNGPGPLPTGFSNILLNPNDHWSWDGPTVTYTFDPALTGTLPPGQANAIRNQIRLAFQAWDDADITPCGTTFSYNRQGPSNNFADLRSIALHEIGHNLGLGHPNQTGFGNINYRQVPTCGGPWAQLPFLGGEVMFAFFNQGQYNHILAHDELDAFGFVYPTGLNFTEVAWPGPANIVVTNYVNVPTNWAQGPPTGVDRPGVLTGTQITSAIIQFNTNSVSPIGFRTLGINWDYQNTSGQTAVSFRVRTRGTNNPTPVFHYDGPAGNLYQNLTTTPVGANFKDDLNHLWTNHNLGGVPPNNIIHVGLEQDVDDWFVVSAEAIDSGGNPSPTPLVSFHTWNHLRPFFQRQPGDGPERQRHHAAAAGHDPGEGLNLPPQEEPKRLVARGLLIRNNEVTATEITELSLANVDDMDLALEDLNGELFEQLLADRRLLTFKLPKAFQLRAGGSLVAVLEGNEEDLPKELQKSGDFVMLEADKELLEGELFVFTATSNDNAEIGNFGLLRTPPISLPLSDKQNEPDPDQTGEQVPDPPIYQ